MPSRVAILTGSLVGKTFPIEKNAFRIGRGAQCDISLPDDGIPEHALTVRYSDGRFTVFSQSNVTASIGNAAVQRGRGTPWRSGEQLSLGDGTILVLEILGDPAPVRPKAAGPSIQLPEIPELPEEEVEQSNTGAQESTEVETPAAELKPRSNKTPQILVIVACLGLGILIVGKKLADEKEPATTTAEITLESLFQRIDERAVDELDEPSGAVLAQLRDSLRIAYRLDQSGNAEAANNEYLRVLRMVRANSDNRTSSENDSAASDVNETTLPQLDDPLFRDVFQFVSDRLSTP